MINTQEEAEGEIDNLGEWLSKWELQEYEQALRKKGIKKPNDFKYIKTKQHFDRLAGKLEDDMSFMDVLKLEDAWKSIVPKPEKQAPQIHFLGDKEKEIMNKLYKRFDDLSEDINTVQKAFNGISYLNIYIFVYTIISSYFIYIHK